MVSVLQGDINCNNTLTFLLLYLLVAGSHEQQGGPWSSSETPSGQHILHVPEVKWSDLGASQEVHPASPPDEHVKQEAWQDSQDCELIL